MSKFNKSVKKIIEGKIEPVQDFPAEDKEQSEIYKTSQEILNQFTTEIGNMEKEVYKKHNATIKQKLGRYIGKELMFKKHDGKVYKNTVTDIEIIDNYGDFFEVVFFVKNEKGKRMEVYASNLAGVPKKLLNKYE